MLLDVGLVFEQNQWLHDEALDELGGRVRNQRQDLLVGEQVSGSLHVTQRLRRESSNERARNSLLGTG